MLTEYGIKEMQKRISKKTKRPHHQQTWIGIWKLRAGFRVTTKWKDSAQ